MTTKEIEATNNIILQDKEMKELIEKLVKKASENDACMTNLIQAIITIWKEAVPVKEKVFELTDEEIAFSRKVENFLQFYEKDLVYLHDEVEKNEEFVIQGKGKNCRKNFIVKIYQIMCSIYVVFNREERMTQAKVLKFAKNYFGSRFCYINDEINLLGYFFYYRLYFCSVDKKPQYMAEYVGGNHSIYAVEEFLEFQSRYKVTNHKINEVSTAVVWFIENYF